MMKTTGLLLFSTVLLVACGGQEKVTLDNEEKEASYAIGYKTGEQMRGQMGSLELEAFIAGMRDGVEGADNPMIKPEEMEKVIMDFQKREMEQRKEKREKAATENKEKSEAFLEENAGKDGVETLDSGIQYKVLESGEEGAESPEATDTVVAHYHGTLIDGTVFDSSVDRGEPATFPLDRVIEGWQIALPNMKVGDKWEIYIPSDLAYGEQGAGQTIGPNQALIFEVELLEVKDEAAEKEEPQLEAGQPQE
jgi:FKBP-type peptidyl-prolyl cis-trans isomerase FklB